MILPRASWLPILLLVSLATGIAAQDASVDALTLEAGNATRLEFLDRPAVDPTHGMMDVLGYAGGLTSTADRGKIRLVRNGEVVTRLDPGSRRLETRLYSGDRIVVGRVGWLRENVAVFIGALGSLAAAAVAGLILR